MQIRSRHWHDRSDREPGRLERGCSSRTIRRRPRPQQPIVATLAAARRSRPCARMLHSTKASNSSLMRRGPSGKNSVGVMVKRMEFGGARAAGRFGRPINDRGCRFGVDLARSKGPHGERDLRNSRRRSPSVNSPFVAVADVRVLQSNLTQPVEQVRSPLPLRPAIVFCFQCPTAETVERGEG